MATPYYLEAPEGDQAQPSFWQRLSSGIDRTPSDSFYSLATALSQPGPFGRNLTQGLVGFGKGFAEDKKRKGLASAFDSMAETIPEQMRPIFEAARSDPEMQRSLVSTMAGNMFAKPSESWKPVDIDGDGRNDYQQSSITGEYKDMPKTLSEEERLRRAGASSMTVNNIPPEIGARTAMGEGFTSNYDAIKERVKKFYSGKPGEQLVRRGQMVFNTGEGGKLWADVETGKEALVRTLTGAGMAQAEAENQASRYGLSPYDTEFDALQKIERLYRDLNNVARGAYSAKGRTYNAPNPGGMGELTYNPATGRLE